MYLFGVWSVADGHQMKGREDDRRTGREEEAKGKKRKRGGESLSS